MQVETKLSREFPIFPLTINVLPGGYLPLQIFEPKYFFPFAGKYTLAGKNSILNKNRGEPDLDYALDYLIKNTNQNETKCQFWI